MNRLGVSTVFTTGAVSMMLVMCACMILTAAILPSAAPLTIISAAIFGPILMAVGTAAGAYKVKQFIATSPDALRLFDQPLPVPANGGHPPGGAPFPTQEELDDDEHDE